MKKKLIAMVVCVCVAFGMAGCSREGAAGAADGQAVSETPGAESTENAGQGDTDTEPASDAAAEGVTAAETDSAEKSGEDAVLNMAYQYGLAYAPLTVAQVNGYIEEKYREATGGELTITWTQMSSGADINTGIASGSIDVGFMGVGPAVTGVTKGLGYKIFTNLSGQEHGLMTNDGSVKSLGDLVGSDKQIALVNPGSIQHIILAKVLSDNGFDPHGLDANIVGMKHPDGMTALMSGSVAAHLTSNPYIYKEREDETLSELTEVSDFWSADRSFIVGVASQTLHDEKSELYTALCDGIAEAIDYINANPSDAAAITAEFDGNTLEDELKYMELGRYSTETTGIFELATFMGENGFIDNAPSAYEDLVFDNVRGN